MTDSDLPDTDHVVRYARLTELELKPAQANVGFNEVIVPRSALILRPVQPSPCLSSTLQIPAPFVAK